MTEPSPRATEPTDAVEPPPAMQPDSSRQGELPATVSFIVPAPPEDDDLPDTFDLPAPPGTVPLPNIFSRKLTHAGYRNYIQCAEAIEELPVATEVILLAHDREWAARILKVAFFREPNPLHAFVPVLYTGFVRSLVEDLRLLARHQKHLLKATRLSVIRKYNKWIKAVQNRIDTRRLGIARHVQDNLGRFEQYNQVAYDNFCGFMIQLVPRELSKAVKDHNWVGLRSELEHFAEYASYATPETLRRILDRVAAGLPKFSLPRPRMQNVPVEQQKMGSNYSYQLRLIRDACAQIYDDPHAVPDLSYYKLGVYDHVSHHRLEKKDFDHFAAHMARRSRDWAWERVRTRFAARLARWAVRYPQSRLAFLATFPPEFFYVIAAYVFPYTPYPN
jgi:hypothetical protein